jgi:excisionase family DNA binding protein
MEGQLVLLSVKEVAQLLGVDRATIGSWNHAGRLPNPEWTVSGGRTPIWKQLRTGQVQMNLYSQS